MNDRKTLLRICALLIAALMLSGCSAVISNPVVGKVGDVEITYSQFYSLFDSYSSYGLVDTSTAEALKPVPAFSTCWWIPPCPSPPRISRGLP